MNRTPRTLRPWALAAIILGSTAVTGVEAASIRNAQTEYMHEGQFQLLREFFTGQESTGNRLVLRTDGDERDGQYFEVQLDTRLGELPANTQVVVEVISTEDLDPRRYEFPLDAAGKRNAKDLLLGLTGKDWPTAERKALAWRIELRAGDQLVGEWKSFLWELP